MPTTKKKTKKVATKPVSRVKTIKKKSVRKTTTKVSKKIQLKSDKIKVTQEQRHKMICEAAYYISLGKTAETVNPTQDWLQAETAINLICIVPKTT